MFEKGQYVNYGKHGVCVIEDVTHMDIPGVDKEKLYYVLSKVYTKGNKIYTAVDNNKVAVTDERFFKEAEEYLYGELALALGIDKGDVEEFIISKAEAMAVPADGLGADFCHRAAAAHRGPQF